MHQMPSDGCRDDANRRRTKRVPSPTREGASGRRTFWGAPTGSSSSVSRRVLPVGAEVCAEANLGQSKKR